MKVLSRDDGAAALALARSAVEHAVGGTRCSPPTLPPIFDEKRGVFVTLKENDLLRGCIGLPYPVMSLAEGIIEAGSSAACEDPRFPPVTASEVADLRIEVTVLTVPQPLLGNPAQRPEMVKVGIHGLIVKGYGMSGLLLPQVPTECGWSSREFLSHTCMKAGLPPDAWKSPDVQVYTFEGQIFCECPEE
ncbi:MAG: TIGR00296 family protein [Methanomicrobiales archaeon]|nr:TIGR00296 family protein [Methanomicrobiales archaeon]